MRQLRSLLLCSLLLILVASSAWGFSVKEWSASLYDTIKVEAEKSFSASFNQPVKIERAGGMILGRIDLYGMTIPGLGRAERVTLSYNPLEYALAKGDMIKALTRITISGGNFQVIRDKRGKWNVLALLPPADKGPSGPPPFAGRLVLRDCRVLYRDDVGFRSTPQNFSVSAEKVGGWVDLRKKNKVVFNVSALVPEKVKAKGSLDQQSGQFEVQVTAEKLPVAKWVNYTVPLPGLTARSGLADVMIELAPAKTRGWPVALTGKFTFYGAAAAFQSYQATDLNGKVFIADDSVGFTNLKGELDTLPVTVNGRLFDFGQLKFDLDISLTDGDLQKTLSLIPQLKEIDLKGRGSAQIKVAGSLQAPQIAGRLTVAEGALYNQPWRGDLTLALKDNLLLLTSDNLALYRGLASVRAAVNLNGRQPKIKLSGSFSRLDLATLAQNSPGIEGAASGTLDLAGSPTELKGKLAARLERALIFGQPMESLDSSFQVSQGNFVLDQLSGRGGNASFSAKGEISGSRQFRLLADAAGLRLSGRGSAGKMSAILNSFRGELSGRLDPAFLASPLRHLSASGEVLLTDGQIGAQAFDRAKGRIGIGNGKIDIGEAVIKSGTAEVALSGQTGIGCATNLRLACPAIELKKLPLVNLFLPPELRDPAGRASFEVVVTGALSSEVKLTSLDPLLDLALQGRIAVWDGQVAEVPLTYAQANITWRDRSLALTDAQLIMPNSSLELDLELKKDGRLSGLLTGVTNLSLFRRLTANYGRIGGVAGFSLLFTGEAAAPQFSSALWLKNFYLNELYFDRVAGSVNWRDGRLTIIDPIVLATGADRYSLDGEISGSDLVLDFKVLQADLGSAYNLYSKGQAEFFRRFSPPTKEGKKRVDLTGFQLPATAPFTDRDSVTMYRAEGKNYFLSKFALIRQAFEKQFAKSPAENLSGTLTGEAKLSGSFDRLSGDFRAVVTRGSLRNYRFDDLEFAATLKDQKLKISQALLRKKPGNLTVRGEYDLDNKLFLHIVANNLPVDLLEMAFPGKKYRGNFNMNAAIDGPLENLRLTAAAAGKSLSLAGTDFDEITFSATKRDEKFYLHELSLLQGGLLSKAYGSVDLTAPGEISLEADLQGNSLGLLNLFTDQVEWRKGSSTVKLQMAGSFEKPTISGRATVNDGTLYVKALDSDLHALQGTASIEGNIMTIQALTGIWQGRRTREQLNPLGVAGTIDLSRVLANESAIDLDLEFSPTKVYLAFPNLYVGVLTIKELALSGPLNFDLSQGPKLTGRAAVADAVITLAQSGQGGKAFPLDLDLTVDLNKNVYAAMGDIATLNLSNILMNLEIAGSGLKIGGSLGEPVMLGQIDVKRGTVNIFNREFLLLNTEQQKKYYPYDADKVQDNRAVFKGREGAAGVMPDINITANVQVENSEKDSEGKTVKKPVNVLARLSGTMGAKEENQGLKIALAAFNEDKGKSPPEMVPAVYSEQDLKVLLLPDFLKSLAGIGRQEGGGGGEQVETNAIVADYLSSRVSTLLFRGVEREIESKLGLESLTLEYNLGPKFREAMGVRDIKGFDSEKPAWSVGFVKGLFDRLYIDVRYSQSMEQTQSSGSNGSAAANSFNYQLMYKLTPIWSIIYYREPISLQQISTGYSKLTLKAGFSFW
jgi:hypothetical protein